MIHASRDRKQLVYLTDCPAIEISNGQYLVGEDGWGDATEGNYGDSYVRLNDFQLIDDFVAADPDHWKQQLQDQGKESADRLAAKLNLLPADARDVLVVTHVPPYREACWYEGQTTDENSARSFFVCGQVGQVLLRTAEAHEQTRFAVLCGHTHHAGSAKIAANLTVYTGSAVYGKPDIEGEVDVADDGIRVERVGP